MSRLTANQAFLTTIGITSPAHVHIIEVALPCGIKTVEEAYRDKTPAEVNLPRAMLIVYWKGMVEALRRLELITTPRDATSGAADPWTLAEMEAAAAKAHFKPLEVAASLDGDRIVVLFQLATAELARAKHDDSVNSGCSR